MKNLIGDTLGHYRIVEQIGAGGMGVVYRAHDEHLDRDVAIKVLPEGVAGDADRLARFKREAKAVAKLEHPNILAIHDFGTEDGVTYAVTELLNGENLRARIPSEGMNWQRVADIGAAVADGLSAAHGQGVVHRDLKPENIFVTTDGRVKVLDFGLAKIREPVLEEAETGTLTPAGTMPGTVMGTLGYMSPEQLRGEAADGRSDIFALGCVLFEMLSGEPAFLRKSTAETSVAILTEDPRSLSGPGTVLPTEFERTISRCLEKSADARFQSSSDLAYNLRSISTDHAVSVAPTAPAPAGRKRKILWAASGVAVAAIATIAVFLGQSNLDRSAPVIESGAIRSLAVLPLENLTGDPEQAYFVDGIHDALISELAGIHALDVTSRTSVIGYRETTSTIPQIAEELAVDAVVEGSIMREENRVAITVQLIDGRTDKHLWQKTFEREMENVLRLRAQVARAIADEIRVAVTPQEEEALASAAAVNPEAYDYYLRGNHILTQYTPERTTRAVESFQRSLDIDPGFAPAWGGLALANFMRGLWIGGNEDWRVILPEAERAARRALALDDRQVEAHLALAGVDTYYHWRWEEAERRLRLAIELDPDQVVARIMYANFLTWLGRYDEAEVQAREAIRIAPLSPLAANELVNVFSQQEGRSDEEWELILQSLELDPHFAQSLMFWAPTMVRRGHVDEGLAMVEEALLLCPDSSVAILFAADAYTVAGQPDRALELVEELIARAATGFVPPGDLFRLYLVLGNLPLALDYLERAFEERDPRMIMLRWMSVNPALAPLTSGPRFQEILRQMDFPEN